MRLRAQGLVHRLVVVYNPRECIILIGATNQLLLREEFADPEDMVDLSNYFSAFTPTVLKNGMNRRKGIVTVLQVRARVTGLQFRIWVV